MAAYTRGPKQVSITKFAWLTDIHLNFLKIDQRMKFYTEVDSCGADYVLITGDIAESPSIGLILTEMTQRINKPIYFVLGNHDYYRDSINDTRNNIFGALLELQTIPNDNRIYWLSSRVSPTIANNSILLIGSDSWADGRYGDYANSNVIMNDSEVITDLKIASKKSRSSLLSKMQELADDDANRLHRKLNDGIYNTDCNLLIVLTHIPSFPDVCKYNRSNTDKEWLPFYSCKATGDVLLRFAKNHADISILVLCGHTHSATTYKPLPNLIVKAGESEYYKPRIQEILTFDSDNKVEMFNNGL